MVLVHTNADESTGDQDAIVPGHRSHGLSVSSVARLMQPPRRGTIASSQYKGLVAARVPGKRNQYREYHKDQHYLFEQVAYCREFTVCFDSECAIFSCDDMNMVKVGALAVSRYHQIQRFFPTDDAPNARFSYPWLSHYTLRIHET